MAKARSSTIICFPVLAPEVRSTNQHGSPLCGSAGATVRTSLPDFVKIYGSFGLIGMRQFSGVVAGSLEGEVERVALAFTG